MRCGGRRRSALAVVDAEVGERRRRRPVHDDVRAAVLREVARGEVVGVGVGVDQPQRSERLLAATAR
jgi:hypothetical protein